MKIPIYLLKTLLHRVYRVLNTTAYPISHIRILCIIYVRDPTEAGSGPSPSTVTHVCVNSTRNANIICIGLFIF